MCACVSREGGEGRLGTAAQGKGWSMNDINVYLLCPARTRLPVRNGLVNEVKFLGLITQ